MKVLDGMHLALLSLILILTIRWLRKRPAINKLPPGPFRWPLIGNIVQLIAQDPKYPHVAFMKLAEKYGPIAFYRIGTVNTVVVSGYDTIKRVLSSDDWLERFDDKLPLERVYSKRIGLIHGFGNLWKVTRKFTVRHLRDYGYGQKESLETFARHEIAEMKAILDDLIANRDGILHVHKFFDVHSVNIIWALITGMRFSHNDPQVKKLVAGIAELDRTLRFSGGNFLASYPELVDYLPKGLTGVGECRSAMKNFRRHLENLIQSYRDNGRYAKDPQNFVEVFLQHIDRARAGELEDPEGMFTEQNLVAILYDFFWAGSDTSSATMSYAILWLTIHPQVQTKLREELYEFIKLYQRPPGYNDRNSLAYTRATCYEIHRRSVPFPLGPRKIDRDTEFDEYVVPKGTSALINYYSVLMDPSFWGDPFNFRPERFLDSENKLVHTERVITFGMGKRNCIGESIAEVSLFLFITALVGQYEFPSIKDDFEYETLPVPGIVQSPPPFAVRLRHVTGRVI